MSIYQHHRAFAHKWLRQLMPIMLVVTLVLSACSTQKNTVVSRCFHNTTAYYNYYYNARDIHNVALKKAEKTYTYNYTLPLPVLLIDEQQIQSAVSGDMDRSIEKCTNLIAKHSITVKPEMPKSGSLSAKEKEFYNQTEFVRWAREAWLLAAISQTWKGDYDRALLSLEYVSLRYPNTPLWFTSQVWMARIATINGNYVDAQNRLDDINKNYKRPKTKDFEHLLASSYAYLHQKQGNNEGVVAHLPKAISNAPNRHTRLRYTYLMAQLQQQNGQTASAIEHYKKAQKLNPSYEMDFSIKLNLIALGGTKGDDLKRALLKMTRDDKNRDYLDHIYYTLGNMERQEGNIEKAMEYYKLSAQSSTDNATQKGMSYLVLADYYFDQANYPQAQSYYDSSMAVIDRNYPNYDEIANKARCLNRLVAQMDIVKHEDSLQRIANMPKAERDALIAGLIEQVQQQEQEQRQQEQDDRQRSMQYQQNQRYGGNKTNDGSGKWYFYNQNSLAYGQSEFQMKWGKRKLEDNWRRKNKTEQMADMPLADNSAQGGEAQKRELSNKSTEYYLVGLPLTDSLRNASTERIKSAMLRIAEIYQHELHDIEAAKSAYANYAKRFSTDAQAPLAYYNLYQLTNEQGKTSEAQGYKATLMSRYPNSPYAMLLANPEYVERMLQQEREQEQHYEQTYAALSAGNHSTALSMARQGRSKYKGTDLEPKYALVEAIATGRAVGLADMQRQLGAFAQTYPNTPEAQHAQQLLAALQANELQLSQGSGSEQTSSERTAPTYHAPNGNHIAVALVPKLADINQLKFNIITFNVDYFIDLDLNVTNSPFNDYVELITIKGFGSQRAASHYLNRLVANQNNVFNPLKSSDYQLFIISDENMDILQSDKSIPDYINFYKQNYK